MAFSDWDITGTTTAVSNADSFFSVINDPLPTPFAGFFCRGLTTSGTSMYISASYQSGAFVNVPNTKMIRAQACLRGFDTSGTLRGGIVVKTSSLTSPGIGYFLTYGPYSSLNTLVFNNAESVSFDNNTLSNNLNVWASIRMDVFPIGSSGDRIVISKETSPGSGVWNPLSIDGGVAADGIFVSSASGRYAPWGGPNRRNGIQMPTKGTSPGGGSDSTLWVDKAYFAVSDAP